MYIHLVIKHKQQTSNEHRTTKINKKQISRQRMTIEESVQNKYKLHERGANVREYVCTSIRECEINMKYIQNAIKTLYN